MSIVLMCNFSLSKKFRALIDNCSVNISFTANKGIGQGYMEISMDDASYSEAALQELLNGKETSLMLTPFECESKTSGSPDDVPTGTLFGNSKTKVPPSIITAATGIGKEKTASMDEFGNIKTKPVAIKKHIIKTPPPPVVEEEIEEIEEIEEVEESTGEEDVGYEIQEEAAGKAQPKKKDLPPILDVDELFAEAARAYEAKHVEVDISKYNTERAIAVALAEQEKKESIDRPAIIVYVQGGTLRLKDMDLSLTANVPLDLRNISARRIMDANSLRVLVKKGIVKFISPEEKEEYRSKADTTKIEFGLPTYGGERGSALKLLDKIEETGFDAGGEDTESIDLSSNNGLPTNIDDRTDMDDLMDNVSKFQARRPQNVVKSNVPLSKTNGGTVIGGVKKTVHTNTQTPNSIGNKSSKSAPPSKSNKFGFKTITPKF